VREHEVRLSAWAELPQRGKAAKDSRHCVELDAATRSANTENTKDGDRLLTPAASAKISQRRAIRYFGSRWRLHVWHAVSHPPASVQSSQSRAA
jgi:hypothetical protein